MEALLNWLRDEREVLKRAPVIAVMLFVFGASLGGAAVGYMRERQVENLQSALTTVQQQRDLWKDKYDSLGPSLNAKTTPKPSPPARVASRQPDFIHQIDIVRTLLLCFGIIGVAVLLVFFVPLPQKRTKVTPHATRAKERAVEPPVPEQPSAPTPAQALAPTADTGDLKGPFQSFASRSNQPTGLIDLEYERTDVRPHLWLEKVQTNISQENNNKILVRSYVNIVNKIGSDIKGCQIYLVVIKSDDGAKYHNTPLMIGHEDNIEFAIQAGQRKAFPFIWKEVNVVPEQRFKLRVGPITNKLLLNKPLEFDDGKEYRLELALDAGHGIVTLVALDAKFGFYEKMSIELSEQFAARRRKAS
jgi:hypothetical protein